MKNIKKMMAIVVVAVMTLMYAVPMSVFGASIELKQEPADFEDSHTYNVYQIFTGDIGQNEEGNQILQNVKYGENFGDTGASVPKSVLDSVDDDARDYAEKLLDGSTTNGEVSGTPIATLTKTNSFKAEGLATGYYLIVDTVSGTLANGDALAQYIVQVLDDVSIDT